MHNFMKIVKERGWTHMKNIVYGSATALLAVPALVSAQFTVPTEADTGLSKGVNGKGIVGILTSIMKWLLTLVGILAVIAFVIAGILYLTAAGDEGQIDRAKKTMTTAIIGVIVALLGLVVLNAVASLFKGQGEFSGK